MSLWQRIQLLFGKRRFERELDDELRFHLDTQIQANLRAGLSPQEARRQAMLELGGLEQVKERVRTARPGFWMETLWQDLRFGARMLRKNAGFTAVAVVTLALGIGATTAIFSVVNPILFEPLPYPHSGRILAIWDSFQGRRAPVTFGTYRELAERSRLFEATAVMKPWRPTMTGPAEPERLEGQRVSARYFHVLGVLPALGRSFESPDDRPQGPRVAILSNGLWQRRFGGDRAIVGRPITLDGNLYTVIGVMPGVFENLLAPSAEIWAPLQYDDSLPLDGKEWGHHLRMVGRLRAEVGAEQARQELGTIAHNPQPDFPRPRWASLQEGLIAGLLQDDVTRAVRPALLAVLSAVVLVLLIACVNVTNLLLARSAQRRREFAVRLALGAARTRLIRQLLTESLLLSAIGGVLGWVVAEFGLPVLVALSPAELPRASAITLNGTVFTFAAGITALVGLLVGLVPGLHAARKDVRSNLQEGVRTTVGGHQFTRRTLVVAEVALTLVLLAGGGLLMRSMHRLFAISPGFDPSHLLTLQVQTSGHRFDRDTTDRFFEQALEAVRDVPGVRAAAFTSQLPLSGDVEQYGVHFESSPSDNPEEDHSAFRYAVSPGYFKAAGIPLRRGRLLDEHDRAGTPLVALISESLAGRKFPGINPLGQRLRIGALDGPLYTIVGVVGDVKQVSLALGQVDAVYVTPTQWHFADDARWLIVRARGDAAALAPAVTKAIWSVDKDQPIVRIATMDALLAATAAERRFALTLFEVFGLAVLVLAAIGIYGVLSSSVTERTREIGVRVALGAQPFQVLELVLGQGIRMVSIGALIGIPLAIGLTRFLQSLLFGVEPTDPLTFAATTALLVGVGLLACWVPARRATRVDPMVALRYE